MEPAIYFDTRLHCTTCGFRKYTADDLARWRRETADLGKYDRRFYNPLWSHPICWGDKVCSQPRRAPQHVPRRSMRP